MFLSSKKTQASVRSVAGSPSFGSCWMKSEAGSKRDKAESLGVRIVDEAGGMYRAVEAGIVQKMIGESARRFQEKVESGEQTIVGRHGGFADKVRCQAVWATPLPVGVDVMKAGPLFCAGITVFHPLVQFGVRPTQRVGVIGIGGLGHLALMFLNKWGCEVTAFSTSVAKETEAKGFGAHTGVAFVP